MDIGHFGMYVLKSLKNAEMLSRLRKSYVRCVFLALFVCFLIGLYSYDFGKRMRTGQERDRQIHYSLNNWNIKTIVNNENVRVDQEISKLKSKESEQYKRQSENLYGNVTEAGRLAKVRTVDSSKSDASDCSKRDVKLFETAQPLTGLVSFPGSGNTWVRHLIQQMTGIGTSSVFCDDKLETRGFPYECETQKGKTIVVKTHDTKHSYMFKKIVLLVRNPYDAFLSYANYATVGHTRHLLSKKISIKVIDYIFNHSLEWYVNMTKNTIGQFKGPVHVVQYEKLKSNIAKELKSLATFLNVNVSNSDIDCTIKNQEGHFHRRTSDAQHLKLLRTVYDKNKLLRLRKIARTSEKLLKDAYNVSCDLGGSLEKTLFQNTWLNTVYYYLF